MRALKEQIDRWAIQAASRSLPRRPADPGQAAEVRRLLAQPGLFTPPERAPEPALAEDFSFQFESEVATPFPSNNTVHGRIFPAGPEWRMRAGVVLLHGWNAEAHYLHVLPRVARALNGAGLNAVLMELPYHLRRRPPGSEPVTNFISEDIPRMLEAVKQAVADMNGVLHWLKREGAPAAALWGFSLGAWLAGIHLCASAAQDAAVLTTPVSNLERAVRELDFCHPIRAALRAVPADLSALNLTARQPGIPSSRIQLVQAQYDLFVPAETCGQLAQSWNLSAWETFPHSHLTILISKAAARRSIGWLAGQLAFSLPDPPRLEAGRPGTGRRFRVV